MGVTALDSLLRPYRQATRGGHLDLAAPGVEVWTIDPDDPAGRAVSGTSYAAAFVTAIAAANLAEGRADTAQQLAARLREGARDLGAPGLIRAEQEGR